MDNRTNSTSREVMEKLEKIQKAAKPEELRVILDELEQHQFFASEDSALTEEQTLVHEKIGALLGEGIINDKILNRRLKNLHEILSDSIGAKKQAKPVASAESKAPTAEIHHFPKKEKEGVAPDENKNEVESVLSPNPPLEPEEPASEVVPEKTAKEEKPAIAPDAQGAPTPSSEALVVAPVVQLTKKRETAEKDETSELIEKTLEDYWPEKEIPGLKLMLSTTIKGYLENYPKSEKARVAIMEELKQFLEKKLFEKSAIFGISAEDQEDLRNRILSSGKDSVAKELEHEIDLKKRAIAKADEDIVEARGKRGTESRGGKEQTDYKIQINKEIDALRKGKKEKLEELEALEDKAKSIDAVAGNLEKSTKRPSAKKLLTYTHYFFINTAEQDKLRKAGKKDTASSETLKKQGEFYKKALAQTNGELGMLKVENLEGPGILKYLGRRSMKLKHLLAFVAEKEMAERFPEKNREQGKKLVLQLREIDPESAKGKAKLDKWIAELGALLPPEGREEATQKLLAATIASMEGSMNGQKWREGVNNFDLKKVVNLTSGIRHAYERRLAQKEGGDIKTLMTKIDTFDKLVTETQMEARGELPKELREYFKANDWLWKAGGFLGVNLKEGAKVMTIGAGRATVTGTKWAFRTGWEKIKAHPKGTAAVTIGLLTGTLIPGLIAYGFYKGYQKYKGQ